jgi:hypothetical protein
MAKHRLLPIWLVDGHSRITLQVADLVRGPSTGAQQLDQLLVDLIDFLAPIGDIHKVISRQSPVISNIGTRRFRQS